VLINLIKRFPAIVPGGAALIGYVGAEIMLSDPMLAPWVASHAPWLDDFLPLAASVLVVLIGGCRAHYGAAGGQHVAAGAARAAAFPAGMLAAQALGRIFVGRLPALIVFLASLFGYAANIEATGLWVASPESQSLLNAARPILAAIIAVVLGECASWLLARLNRR
jgi:hypothetical protein